VSSRKKRPCQPRSVERESIGFRRRREKRERVERFLAGKPLIAGIDLAKKKHAVWLTGRDLVPIERFTIQHSNEGVDALLERTKRVCEDRGFDRLLVFMEATSHFWMNVANALKARGVEYRTVAPVAVDRQREIAHLTYAKGDFRDAELIARLGGEGNWLARVLETEPVWIELAALAREHEMLLVMEKRERQRIRAFLERAVPDLLEVFDDPLGKTAATLLRCLASPPVTKHAEIAERAATLAGRRIHTRKARALAALLEARPSYGVECSLVSVFRRIGLALDRYDFVSHQREQVRVALVEASAKTPFKKWLDTIPGVDPANNAIVLGLVGDPRHYDRSTCFAKHAGTEPRENHSGDGEGSHSISKRGLPRLRHIAFRVVAGFMLANTPFATYVKRLMKREKNPLSYHQALVASSNKYLRLFHHLCVKKQAFDAARIAAPL
jgi:transposase